MRYEITCFYSFATRDGKLHGARFKNNFSVGDPYAARVYAGKQLSANEVDLLTEAGILDNRLQGITLRQLLNQCQELLVDAGYNLDIRLRRRYQYVSEDNEWKLAKRNEGWQIKPFDIGRAIDKGDGWPRFATRDAAVAWAQQRKQDVATARRNGEPFPPVDSTIIQA